MMFRRFKDRSEAGREVAKALSAYANKKDAIVLALPRGGVPVAAAVAEELSLPLDIWLVRKLGVPGHEELAMGALSMGGICHIDQEITRELGIPEQAVKETIVQEYQELERRNKLYRHDMSLPDLKVKTAIVVDDGLATGSTMHAAILSLRKAQAKKIIAAVPVGAVPSCSLLRNEADDVICVQTPDPFWGVGQWYSDFSQVSDEEVLEILDRHNGRQKVVALQSGT